jgi:hypothetical protein
MSPATVTPDTTTDESRRSRRFVFRHGWQASFAATSVSVIDISETGLQVEHAESIAIGKQGQVTLSLRPGNSVTVPARIVWSRFGKGASGDQKVFRSGLVFPSGREDVAENVLELLLRAGVVEPDPESLRKKENARAARAQRRGVASVAAPSNSAAASDTAALALARKAKQYLHNHPEEAGKWLNRARYAINRSKQRDPLPLDQLAVWEFLERKVDLEIVRLAFQLRA